jgi:hypothetical protein
MARAEREDDRVWVTNDARLDGVLVRRRLVADLFASMVEMASRGGCRKAARVSSGSVLGPLQMSRIASSHAGYPSRQFETWEEAEAYLDEAP